MFAGVFGGCFNSREFSKKFESGGCGCSGRVRVSNPLSSPRCEVYTSDSQGKPSERGGNGQIISNVEVCTGIYLSNGEGVTLRDTLSQRETRDYPSAPPIGNVNISANHWLSTWPC